MKVKECYYVDEFLQNRSMKCCALLSLMIGGMWGRRSEVLNVILKFITESFQNTDIVTYSICVVLCKLYAQE